MSAGAGSSPRGLLTRVLLKGLLLFAAANLVWAALVPLGAQSALGRISLYNRLFPGRQRFPFGENSEASYNLSLYNLDAMFASHEISAPKPADELRVVFIGDSSVWGTLLENDQTLAGQVNALGLACGGKRLRAYNLGYPTISLAKDWMILRRALAYNPDLIVWATTLEAFPFDRQLASPLAANNLAEFAHLAVALPPAEDESSAAPGFLRNTIIGQRRPLADLLRLQAYGVMWAATGIDQEIPASFTPAAVDLEADASYHGWLPEGGLPQDKLAFDVLAAGMQLAAGAGVPVLLVNEPMLISAGQNSAVRYNFFYPRWAYDSWRSELNARAQANGWPLLDLWDLLPASEYTNSAIHLTPRGEAALAARIAPVLAQMCAP